MTSGNGNSTINAPRSLANSPVTERGELAWQLMLRRLPALVWTTDHELNVASAGGVGGEFGRDLQTFVGRPIGECLQLTEEADSPVQIAHAQALAGSASTIDYVLNRKAYRLYLEPLANDGEVVGCVGMAIDITPRRNNDFLVHPTWNAIPDEDDHSDRGKISKRLSSETEDRRLAEQSLRENHDRLVQLAASIDSAFWIEDRMLRTEGRVIYLSPGYANIFGQSIDAALQSEDHAVWSAVHPDDQERVNAIFIGGQAASLTADFRICRPDGSFRWIRARAFPVMDAAGQVQRVAGVAEDITRRKEDEDRQRRCERLATLGNFVAGIAHEINNPLGAALSANQAALRLLPVGCSPVLQQCLDTSLGSIRRCVQIVRSLLGFCRDEPAKQSEFDLRDVIAAAETITRSYAQEHHCEIVLNTGAIPLPANGSPLELELVFVNLLRNAVEAGARRVTADCRLNDNEIEITIEDNGCGIPAEQTWRLGEPFFTTRQKSGGTGLGLTVVQNIMREHAGKVEFIRQEQGTVVRVTLPPLPTGEPRT